MIPIIGEFSASCLDFYHNTIKTGRQAPIVISTMFVYLYASQSHAGQLGLRAKSISVSPGQSQNKPLGERAASSARKSASNACSRPPNRCGAAKEVDR